MKIGIKTEIWRDINNMRKVLDRGSMFTTIMFAMNVIGFWGKWWMFSFNLFFLTVSFLIQLSHNEWEDEERKKTYNQIKKIVEKEK